MGLSASQARLLSITARLSDNELHSQQIANSKVRLADQTQAASREYIDALNTTKLMYTTYDAKGNATQVNLTGSTLYTYEPLKNQYTLQDVSGLNYVSYEDASNYENTNNMYDFLNCYGLIANLDEYHAEMDNYKQSMVNYELEMGVYRQEYAKYQEDMKIYQEELKIYQEELADYNKQMEEYKEAYELWLSEKNGPKLYDEFSAIVGTSSSPRSCYSSALNGYSGCYIHVLARLLDWQGGRTYSATPYTATNGKTVSLNQSDITGAALYGDANEQDFVPISEEMNNSERKCDGDDNLELDESGKVIEGQNKENNLETIIASGGTPSELDILLSDYIYDPNTNTANEIKTLKQKAIDLLYALRNNLLSDRALMKESLINFTDGDMKNISSEPEEPVFEAEMPEMPEMPEPPVPPLKPTMKIKVNDLEKGQWYVNLWYMMNGSDSANILREDMDDSTNGYYIVDAGNKNDKQLKNYKVLTNEQLNSPTWLKFALEQGLVTINKAQYYNPGSTTGSEDDVFTERIIWSLTSYASITELSETEDEVAIAKAEAEYTRKLNDIEAKDKKYDTDLKKLDTEHNALQTEYDSVKSVIEKNVDRSFKAFS